MGRIDLVEAAESANQQVVFKKRLEEFCRLQKEILPRLNQPNGSQPYILQRYDVDPLIAEVAPPSFVFENLDAKRTRDASNPYTLGFLAEVLQAALKRIERVWPEMVDVFPSFVKIIIHLPDIESRSCSAQRFAGAIMLSASDDSLLAMEESLIHECGHQILYCVMELDPLIRRDAKGSFVLPWSGSERDAYGYFHATYIYLILALFFERALGRESSEDETVRQRLVTILHGLERALADFETAECFTTAGRMFFHRMGAVGREAIGRNPY